MALEEIPQSMLRDARKHRYRLTQYEQIIGPVVEDDFKEDEPTDMSAANPNKEGRPIKSREVAYPDRSFTWHRIRLSLPGYERHRTSMYSSRGKGATLC